MTIAESKIIDAIADPIARGYALLRSGKHQRAIQTFESAGYQKGTVQAQALMLEQTHEWQQAADLWQSIGDAARHAAAMAEFARSKENWEEAARWHHIAGQRTLAAEAERAARAKRAAEAGKITREHPRLF